MEKIRLFLSDFWKHSYSSSTEKILATILGIILLFIVRSIIIKVSRKSIQKDVIFIRWKKGTNTGFYIFSLILCGFIWIQGFNSFATLVGLVSAGMAIAFKEPLLNIGGWAYILARRPFIIGDRIEIDGIIGEVLDIRLFMFSLQEAGGLRAGAEQVTGRIVHVPNAKVFTLSVSNFTETTPYIFHEINILLSLNSKWELVEAKLLEIMENHPEYWKAPQKLKSDNNFREYYLFGTTEEPIVFAKLCEDGIELCLRYTAEPRKLRKTEDAIWRQLIPFVQHHKEIQLAYRPRRIISESNQGGVIG
jgi:small-conductance mechanosensitive channel